MVPDAITDLLPAHVDLLVETPLILMYVYKLKTADT
jgi:hypothetical protein